MSGELWITLVDTADIVGFTMTFCVNIVLLGLLRTRGKNLGTYKYLMAFFSVFSIFYAIIESILRPIMHIENATFFLISRKRFNYSTRLGKINSAFYCACFATSFVVSGVHFVYRFFATCKPDLLRLFNMPYLLLWPLGCSIPVTMWASVSYFLYPDTEYTEAAVSNVLKTHYNWIKMENVSYIAYVYYQYDENGVKYVYIKNLLGCFVHYFVMSMTFVVMFYCGYATWKTMNEHKEISNKTRQLQSQLFKALVLQTLIPSIFMYAPTGVMFIAPFFNIDLNANANFIVFCSFLYPGLDPLILILIIRDFRQTIFKVVCRGKKNSVDESRSTTRANLSHGATS
ncbi:CRE-ODR-10 protein [Caenorhabditis remanei]|uniref:Serpentine receptor class r-10 n=1 Tax=Caenorhabditis remanei TaxID=31234 RepID=C3U4Y0_CAERE|nr:ODR10 [Caenorhabditis remanei]EFO83002.1 CRE-ODR-10 protein [Caenorhabditis remanei]